MSLVGGGCWGFFNGTGAEEKRRNAGRRYPGSGDFRARRVVAELVDDARFPFHRAVPRVGGIQRRFLVGVVGILLAQLVHALGRGEAAPPLPHDFLSLSPKLFSHPPHLSL